MKTRGFTLIELLGVIIILALLLILTFPNIINSIKKANDKTASTVLDLIYHASKLYVSNHSDDFPKISGSKYIISLDSLQAEDLLSSSIKLSDNSNLINSKCVQVAYTDKYTYELKNIGECEENIVIDNVNYTPQFYIDSWVYLGHVGDNAPNNPLSEAPSQNFYLGYDVSDGKISAGYVCFVRNNTQYCLKNGVEYSRNKEIIKMAAKNRVKTSDCNFSDGTSPKTSKCVLDSSEEIISFSASSSGYVQVNDYIHKCHVGAESLICRGYDQSFFPSYYAWGEINSASISIPNDLSNPPKSTDGVDVFLGFDINNNAISSVYICYYRLSQQFCILGANTQAGTYEANKDILERTGNADCTIYGGGNSVTCNAGGYRIRINSQGYAQVTSGGNVCVIRSDGFFECY